MEEADYGGHGDGGGGGEEGEEEGSDGLEEREGDDEWHKAWEQEDDGEGRGDEIGITDTANRRRHRFDN